MLRLVINARRVVIQLYGAEIYPARPTATIALCGLKFFYEQTLKQPWPPLRFVRPARVEVAGGAKPTSRKRALKFQITQLDPRI